MSRVIIFFSLFIVNYNCCSAESKAHSVICKDSPNAQEVLDIAISEGPDPIIKAYNCRGWIEISSGIARGTKEWLLVARSIKPYSDAAMSEELNENLAKALQKKPELVLELFGTPTTDWLEQICTCPLIEPKESEAEAFIKKSIEAIVGVKDEFLKDQKESCLNYLKEDLKLIKEANFPP